MVGVQVFAAEDYRYQIRAKTREALVRKAKLGNVAGTRTFGYDMIRVGEHSERGINEGEAAVVKRIFEMSAGGQGDKRIVQTLNTEHVPAPGKSGTWAKDVIRNLLRNRLYVGEVVYGRTRGIDKGGSAGKRQAVPQDDWIRVPVPKLRIVPDELWERVQRRRAQTSAHFARTDDGRLIAKPESALMAAHLASGIGRCPHCGGALVFNKKNATSRRYYCSQHLRNGSCPNGYGISAKAFDQSSRERVPAKLEEDGLWG